MTQLHRRLTDDQVKVLLNGYCQGLLGRAEVQEMLGIAKTRFFALLKEYRNAPDAFSATHGRTNLAYTRAGPEQAAAWSWVAVTAPLCLVSRRS